MSNYKPNDVPTWAESGDRVEPPVEKKEQGFIPGERAHAQYFNWIFNRIGSWLQWLDDLFPRPLSTVSGRRYLSMGGDTETPGLELRGGSGGAPIGEIQWSDSELEDDDKRLVSMSAGTTDGYGRLDIHVRGDSEEPLGDPCASLDAYNLHLKGLSTGRLKLPIRDPDDYLQLEAGSHSVNVLGRSRVCVVFHETDPELSGIGGGTEGQILLCRFVRSGGATWNTLTLRNEDARPPTSHRFCLKDGDVIINKGSSPWDPCCLFIKIENRWRLIAADF